jgi:hypothetical protein
MMNVLGYRAARRVRLLCVLCFALLASVLAVVLVAQAGTVATNSFGSSGTGAGQFGSASPAGLAVNKASGNVYAVDTGNNRVEEFDKEGTFIRAFGWGVVQSGPDATSPTPADAVQSINVPNTVIGGNFTLTFEGDTTGEIPYNAEAWQVEEALNELLDIKWNYVEVAGGPGATGPFTVTFEGKLAYTPVPLITADSTKLLGVGPATTSTTTPGVTGGFENCNVQANPTDVCQQGLASGGAGAMNKPRGIAVDQTNGNLYVTDNTNSRIDVFSATGAFEGAFGWKVNAEKPEAKLQFCTTTTGCLAGVGGTGAGQLGTAFSYPAVDPSTGNVYVVEQGYSYYTNYRADEFHPTISGGNVTDASFVRGFGWGVQNGAGEFQVCTTTCLPGQNSGASPGGLQQASRFIAVDSTGALYTVSKTEEACNNWYAVCRVQKFNGSGTTAAELAPAEFAPTYLTATQGEAAEVAAGAIAIGANNDLLVVKPNSPTEQRIYEFNPSGKLVDTHGIGSKLPAANGLAAVESSRLYLSTSTGNEVYILTPPPAPTATISPVTAITTTTATFNGTVTPPPPIPFTGFDTTYHFEYSANGATWTSFPASDVDVGSVNLPVAVHQSVAGLSPNTLYQVRLLATTGTPATSSATGFTTAATPPTVSNTVASPVTATTAKLTGYVNPNNSPTSYYYEWGLTASYGNQAPANFTPFIGAGGQPLFVPVSISGLTPATTYHFRLVATSPAGTTSGPDEEFATLSPEGTCANEALRAESALDPATGAQYSTQLPDCRAYELVTPPFKDAANITLTPGISSSGVQAIADGGSPLTFTSPSLWGTPGTDVANLAAGAWYVLTRNTDGWSFSSLTPPQSQLAFAELYVGNPTDPPAGIYLAATPAQPITAADLYLRTATGTFTAVGPVTPPAASAGQPPRGFEATRGPAGGAGEVGASADMRRIAFSLHSPSTQEDASYLWPGDLTALPVGTTAGNLPSLYEYVGAGHTGEGGDVPSLVGVDNAGAQITQCGTGLGGGNGRGAVSAGGSTVFFSASAGGCRSGATGPAVNQLYARIGAAGSAQATVNVAGVGESGRDQVQTLEVTATGGEFKLNYGGFFCFFGTCYGGETTSALPYNVTATALQAALEALGAIGTGNVAVTEGAAGRYEITFQGALGGTEATQLLIEGENLTGGTATDTITTQAEPGCAVSAACIVSAPVSYQGAAKDGSKVFFTSTQALLPSDKDTTNDVYECELPGDAGATPAPSGKVNACPSLKAISVTGTSSGANVKSVVAVSEEGSRVYYIATGVVSSAPNSQGQVAQQGQDNLYVYEPDPAHPGQQKTAFIAALPTASLAAGAQATPSGRYLVFTTAADLTPDDTSTVAQAFRFDAQSGELIRVSIGQNGFNANGNTTSAPASLAIPGRGAAERRGITISEDGSYVVFQSNDALTPQVQGGLRNVYEWHDGNVSLISGGTDTNENAGLIGMDASGANVFFTTADKLVGQDVDASVDVYDARIGGGFPAPLLPAGCKGEECQGPLSGALSQVILGSTGAPAIGNLPAPPPPKTTTTPKPKPLTKAQKLAKALKQCKKDKAKTKRKTCEAKARRRYKKK